MLRICSAIEAPLERGGSLSRINIPMVRDEYPRPRLVRKDWMSLNGTWEFQFDPRNVGLAKGYVARSKLNREITVPFAYQTPLSGVDDQSICEVVWYAKAIAIPEAWSGKRILLHFGAVDYETSVWINGRAAGVHQGGYVPFTIDVTRYLIPGANRVCLRVFDSQDPGQPRGKQASSGKPHSIDYWCTTGIWQSVWLEPVSSSYLGDLSVSSDIDKKTLYVTPVVYGGRADLDIEVTVLDGAIEAAKERVCSTCLSGPIELRLESPKLWTPDRPYLYGLRVDLVRRGEIVDSVESYGGMRSVNLRGGKILLNGEPIFLKMALDQGYWPESGLTAPSDAALERDVLLAKALGLNGVRKHQKVEDPRSLYWCDVHGLMVWGEMANARSWSEETQERLESEWMRVVVRDRSHPCIIAWVPINESMGFPALDKGDPEASGLQRGGVERLALLTRRLDPTRPVIDNDGWEQTQVADIVAIHDYSHSGAELKERYAQYLAGKSFPEKIWSGSRRSLLSGVELDGRPIVLSEVGGFLTVPPEGEELDHLYSIYSSIRSSGELLEKYRELIEAIGSLPFLSGFCYTQFTDVYQELNGLLHFDRSPKADIGMIAEIHRALGRK